LPLGQLDRIVVEPYFNSGVTQKADSQTEQ